MTVLPLQIQFSEELARVLALVIGLAVLSGGLATVLGLLHRWYVNERIPHGLAVLTGLSGVALYLNTTATLGGVIGGNLTALDPETALLNGLVFIVAGLAAATGGGIGDRLGANVFALAGATSVEAQVSQIVSTVGRVTPIELPEDPDDIGDIDGYDPVAPGVKDWLAGRTLVFPRRLTVEELRERFVTRLKTDYNVGHVDVEIDETGTIEYLAVGRREAGLGPTLPPETVGVAIRADPAFAATPGDVVQVWHGDPPALVTTAEIRGTTEDVVTLAVDAADADVLDHDRRYRLVTLPIETRMDREFASLLRAADETLTVVTLQDDSPLVGLPIGALAVAVVAVRGTDQAIEAIPTRSRTIEAGDAIYAVARPEKLRRLEAAATGEVLGRPTPH